MKRYIIYARRKGEKQWSVWTDTDDINNIEKHVNRIRELGYEEKVTDPAITCYEKKIEQGYLLHTPVCIGQTVYAVVDAHNGGEPHIEEWEVKELHFDGTTWLATNNVGVLFDVGSNWCIPIKKKAEKILKELKGDSDERAD